MQLSAFEHDSRGYGDGYRTRCRECRYAQTRNYAKDRFGSAAAGLKHWRSKAENLAKDKAYAKEYRRKKPEVEHSRFAAWRQKNKAALNAKRMEYEARKLRATPKWANKKEIESFYVEAERLSTALTKYHVDHIVPLKSPLVCGLHWEGNLRVLPAKENVAKSNRTWPDAP